jgi:transcriptional regulator with XRE-family HTH domain
MLEDATALHDHFAERPAEPGAARAALGPRIRQARLKRLQGLNLEVFGRQIAEQMGRRRAFSNVTISNWETGRQEPSFEALVAIARLTHLPLRYFAGVGEIDEYPQIDWLASDRQEVSPRLGAALVRAATLGEPAMDLVAALLKSLINELYRLAPERTNHHV